jgi:hypothetical protein
MAVYLNDHAAGAAGVTRRAERLAREEHGADRGYLDGFVTELHGERDILRRIMQDHGVAERRWKQVVARVAEVAGLLKMNGTGLRRSPLSSVLELELIVGGVNAKRALWRSLQEAEAIDDPLAEQLIAQADDQIRRLMSIHDARAGQVIRVSTAPATDPLRVPTPMTAASMEDADIANGENPDDVKRQPEDAPARAGHGEPGRAQNPATDRMPTGEGSENETPA